MRQEARIDYVATQPTVHRDSMIVRHLIRAAPREKTVIQRMLDVAKCAVVAGAFMLGAEACNTPQSMSATLVGSPGLADERTSSVQVTAGALRTELLAFADLSIGEMEGLGMASGSTNPSPDERAFLQSLRADVASTVVALALEPDPEAALQDLMVSMAAKRIATAGSFPEGVSTNTQSAIASSMTRLEKEIWDVGGLVYSGAELAALRARVGQWWSGSERSSLGVIRVRELPTVDGPRMTKGLFAPINETNRQIEESRLLGERFLFLVERLPAIAVWQAEAAAWRAMATPESRGALESLTLMATTLEQLAERVDSLPALMDDQREAFLSAFDAREETLSSLLFEARTAMADAAPLLESGELIAGLSNEAVERLSRTLEATERLIATLRDASAPGGAVSLDVRDYAVVIGDIRATSEALSEALERADALSELPQALVDHAAWRAAQLILLLFVLLVVYRFGIPMLQRTHDQG